MLVLHPSSNPKHTATNGRGQTYIQPVVAPEGATSDGGATPWFGAPPNADHQSPVQLQYIDATAPPQHPNAGQSPAAPGSGLR